jgi:hypothetical protein
MSFTEQDMVYAAKSSLHDSHDEPMNSMDDVVRIVRKMEQTRIIELLKAEECFGCDLGDTCNFVVSRDYLIRRVEDK